MSYSNTNITKQKGVLVFNNATDTIKFTINCQALYNIIPTLEHISSNINNATRIKSGETLNLLFTADTGYYLPQEVEVTGANSIWNEATGSLTLSNPTDTVIFSIIAPDNLLLTNEDKFVHESSDKSLEVYP